MNLPFLKADAPVVNVAAVVTLAKDQGSRFRLLEAYYSYSAGTPVGALTISGLRDEDGALVTFDMDVDGVGSGRVDLHGLSGDDRADIVVTLEAGGALAFGRLNVVAVKEHLPRVPVKG